MDAPIGGDCGGQGVHHLLELDAVAVGEQEAEEVVPRSPARLGLGPQVRQGVGVRRVAGFRFLGLGQSEVVEKDFLELLGAGEVHLASGGGPGSLTGGVNVGSEFGGQVVEDARVRGDARGFHLCEEARQRHLHVGKERGFAALIQRPTQLVGERVERCGQAPCAHLGGAGALTNLAQVKEGVGIRGFLLDGDAEQAGEHILELVRALVRVGQVRREHRVEGDVTERPAARSQGVSCSLRVVGDQ